MGRPAISPLTLDGGTLLAPNYLAVTADAFGGDGATAGSATGGTSTFEMTANGGSITTNNFELHSWGNYNGGGELALMRAATPRVVPCCSMSRPH